MENSKVSIQNMDLYYGDFHALKNLNLEIPANQVTAFIGPSGCGKSTCIKSLNRMNDLIDGCKITGTIKIDGEDIYDPRTDVTLLRKRAGMVFQKANPFPMSVYDNIAYGPRVHGIKNRAKLDEIVETSLKQAAIWDEVKDRLKKSALGMSGGQQQRVGIARALVVNPQIIFADEPTGNLDSKTTMEVLRLMQKIVREQDQTLVMVTHDNNLASYADRRIRIMDGRIVGIETGGREALYEGNAEEKECNENESK